MGVSARVKENNERNDHERESESEKQICRAANKRQKVTSGRRPFFTLAVAKSSSPSKLGPADTRNSAAERSLPARKRGVGGGGWGIKGDTWTPERLPISLISAIT